MNSRIRTVLTSIIGLYLMDCGKVECEDNASYECYRGNVYHANSCGVIGELAKKCSIDEVCSKTRCVNINENNDTGECTPNYQLTCHDSNVYHMDSCGNIEELVQVCDYDCREAQCVDEGCVPHFELECYHGDVWWKDNCGMFTEIYDMCTGEEECVDAECR